MNKKDKVLTVVISGITASQGAELQKRFTIAKEKVAPNARGTVVIGGKDTVSKRLQKGTRLALTGEDKSAKKRERA